MRLRWAVVVAVALGHVATVLAARPGIVGQWIWCDADGRHFAEARAGDPHLVPAVF